MPYPSLSSPRGQLVQLLLPPPGTPHPGMAFLHPRTLVLLEGRCPPPATFHLPSAFLKGRETTASSPLTARGPGSEKVVMARAPFTTQVVFTYNLPASQVSWIE